MKLQLVRRFFLIVSASMLCCFALASFFPGHALAQAPGASASFAAGASSPAAAAVDNPYGLAALWAQSDLVAKAVLVMLALMSIASWYVIVTKAIEQTRMSGQAKRAGQHFWAAPNVEAGVAALHPHSSFRFVAEAGVAALRGHARLRGKVDFGDWLDIAVHRAADRVQRRLGKGMSLLATVGSTSPFIGLFGTVWGIYHALTAIGIAGQASIDKVAGPVGEALIMTAIGLAVAVPAVLGYNFLLRRNAAAMEGLRDFGTELHTALLVQSPA